MTSSAKKQLQSWLKTISIITQDVIDIGGSAKPISSRVGEWVVENYKILDVTETKEKVDYLVDIQSETVSELFDVAFCLEVMEYLHKPNEALKNISRLLKPNGILYISFLFLYPTHPPAGMDMLRYTSQGARELLEEAGFKIIQHTPRKPRFPFLLKLFCLGEGFQYDKKPQEIGCLIKAQKT